MDSLAAELTGKPKGYVCTKLLQSCLTLCDPMDCIPPGSSVHGILQARILEWVTISFSRGPSQPRDSIWVSYLPASAGIVPVKWGFPMFPPPRSTYHHWSPWWSRDKPLPRPAQNPDPQGLWAEWMEVILYHKEMVWRLFGTQHKNKTKQNKNYHLTIRYWRCDFGKSSWPL